MRTWLEKNNLLATALWIATLGLFLASSGIDGVYLMSWMPLGWGWLGLILNTMVDLTSELIMYWYGRLRLMPVNTKRYRQSKWLLFFEGGLMGFQWFFSWLQLRTVIPPEDAWVAPIGAAFVPFAIVAVGYTQALLAGRLDTGAPAVVVLPPVQDTQPAEILRQDTEQPAEDVYKVCEPCGFTAHSPQAWAGHCKGKKHKENMANVEP